MEKSTQIFTIMNTKRRFQFICLSVILINSVVRTGKNYYPQVFFEECKYVVQKKEMPEFITDNI